MEDAPNGTAATRLCAAVQCNPQQNPTGLCLEVCYVICPYFCRIIDLSPPPSSSSSSLPPANSPYASPTTTKHHHPPLSLPLRISLFFLVATFSLFFLYTFCKFCTVWYRSRRHRTAPPPSPEYYETHDIDVLDHPIWYIRTTGLQPSEINAITIVKYSKGEGVVEGSDCSVCLSEFEADESLRLLPNCKHAFHISCIDTWLRSHTNCPICRAGIVNNTVNAPSPEQNSDDMGFMGETNLGISNWGDDNRGEASESSALRIGETDEEDVNNTAKAEVVNSEGNRELLIIRRPVPDHHGITFEYVDEGLGMESVKIDQTTGIDSPKRDG